MSLAVSMFLILRQMYQHFLYGLCLLGEFFSKYYQYRTQKVNSKFASKTLKILFSTFGLWSDGTYFSSLMRLKSNFIFFPKMESQFSQYCLLFCPFS